MKHILTFFLLLVFGCTVFAQVSLGTTSPAASAALELSSSDQGFLPPRMRKTRLDAISSPSEGLLIYCLNCLPKGIYYFNGIEFVHISTNSASGAVSTDVVSLTGRTWMDRNLGAIHIASSSSDFESYGNLYQWGRASDGHEVINWTRSTGSDGAEQSRETATIAATATPGHDDFILAPSGDNNWTNYDPPGDNPGLWESGVNDPCPVGYYVPTESDFEAEILTWPSLDSNGALSNVLRLPLAGARNYTGGQLISTNQIGYYWTSNVSPGANSITSRFLFFNSDNATISGTRRALGAAVRCIKN